MEDEQLYKKYRKGITTDYGHSVKVYRSSSAEKDAMWLVTEHDGTKQGYENFKGEQHAHVTFA